MRATKLQQMTETSVLVDTIWSEIVQVQFYAPFGLPFCCMLRRGIMNVFPKNPYVPDFNDAGLRRQHGEAPKSAKNLLATRFRSSTTKTVSTSCTQ